MANASLAVQFLLSPASKTMPGYLALTFQCLKQTAAISAR